MAPVVSHIITRLGREVREAREMGSYLLGDLIARGGMGEVWQATHRFLVQRFRREAMAAAALHSSHTIQLYDFGVARDGTFYYVMELLNGMDLQTLVSRHGPLPPARAIYLLQQVCEFLGEAHDRGLIHRDVKPANIQVCRLGRDCDFVKVLDFGLVKRTPGEKSDVDLTTPNMLAGTPAYLSPESALGEPVDQRTDIADDVGMGPPAGSATATPPFPWEPASEPTPASSAPHPASGGTGELGRAADGGEQESMRLEETRMEPEVR